MIIHIFKKILNKNDDVKTKKETIYKKTQKDIEEEILEEKKFSKKSKRKIKKEIKKELKRLKREQKLSRYTYLYIIVFLIFSLYFSFNLLYSQFFGEELRFNANFTHLNEMNYILFEYDIEEFSMDKLNFNAKENDTLYLTFSRGDGVLKVKEGRNRRPKSLNLKAKVIETNDDMVKVKTDLPRYIKKTLSSGTYISKLENKKNGIVTVKKVLGSYKIVKID